MIRDHRKKVGKQGRSPTPADIATSGHLIQSSSKFLFFLILICLLFCNIIITGEPAHTASKEVRAPELMFLSEHVSQPLITAIILRFQLVCSAYYTALQTKNNRRSASTINPVTTKNTNNSFTPTIPITDL